MNDERVRVLFVSRDNATRGQMAEAFLRELGGEAFEVCSAGSLAHEVHPLAVEVMAERGIDISRQRSKELQEYIGAKWFDYLITVCDRLEKGCPMFPGPAAREYWPFQDPGREEGTIEKRLARFRLVRDGVETRVRSWLEKSSRKPPRSRAEREHSSVPVGWRP